LQGKKNLEIPPCTKETRDKPNFYVDIIKIPNFPDPSPYYQ